MTHQAHIGFGSSGEIRTLPGKSQRPMWAFCMKKFKQKRVLVDMRARKASALMAMAGKSDNEIAALIKPTGDGDFLLSAEWKAMRKKVVDHYGAVCMCCGATPKRGINVDHIKPRKLYPELSLNFDNLQVLCGRCNKGKGNKHMTDYRLNPSRPRHM